MPAVTYTSSTPVTDLPGLGAKAAAGLAKKYRTASELARAAAAGEVAIPAITRAYAEHPPRALPLERAAEIARKLKKAVQAQAAGSMVAIVGSVRRERPVVGDIDILVSADCGDLDLGAAARRAGGEVLAEFASGPARRSCILRVVSGSSRVRVAFDLFSAPAEEWGTALLHFTGSSEFNIRLRARAKEKGYSLSQHGLKSLATGRVRRCATEAAAFAALGIAPRPPSQRQK